MPKIVKNFAQLEGPIFAYLYPDGTLSFEIRNIGRDAPWSYAQSIVLSPEGVKNLIDVLDSRRRTMRAPDKGGDWLCKNCNCANLLSDNACTSCGTPRPRG